MLFYGRNMETITGAKGGSQKQHTPVEQPDSAQSMARCRMLLALGEGEFAGGLDATRIFLDGTPLGNADGSMNFENVSSGFSHGNSDSDTDPRLSCCRKRNQHWRFADESRSMDKGN